MATLVTGATGLVGNNVVRQLVERGEPVHVLAREGSDPRPLEGLVVTVHRGDVRNREEVNRSCSDVDTVIHAAAHIHIGWKNRELSHAINVDGTRNVAQAARSAGAKLIHVSSVDSLSPGTADEPANEETQGVKTQCTYVVTKREAEQAVTDEISQGLNAVIVHPGFMLGPWDWKPSSGRMLLEIASRFTPLAPTGGMSACDVRDVAAGILAAVEKGTSGRHYILAGHNITYFDAWKRFAQIAGRNGPTSTLGPVIRFLAGSFGDLWANLTGRESDVNSAAIQMSCMFHYYTSARAEKELGYEIRPLKESIEAAWEWFEEHDYV